MRIPMPRTSVLATALVAALALPAQAQTEIQWWHSMTAVNNEWVNDLAKQFNESQKAYKVVPTFKGNYTEGMTAAIAAFRSGNAPHILQVFEVGTATMMASQGATVPVGKVMADAGHSFDPSAYIPAVAGYYTAPNGQMLSFPFNSSTTIFYINKDAFRKAGLNADKAPATWPEVFDAAKKLKASGHSCPMTLAWQGWTQLESFSTWHNVEFATHQNGLAADGYKARMKINSPLHVKHIDNLATAAKAGEFVYKGRGSDAQASFTAGECAMIQTSSGFYGDVAKNAKFAYGLAPLPYYPDAKGAPQNTVIGGASLWAVGHVGQEARRIQGRGGVLQLPVADQGAGRQPPAHRLSADHPGRLRPDRQVRLLPEEPRHRHGGDADDPQDHRQVARHPPGQLRADPHHRGRRAGTGVGRPQDGQGSAGQHRHARQRTAGALRGGEPGQVSAASRCGALWRVRGIRHNAFPPELAMIG